MIVEVYRLGLDAGPLGTRAFALERPMRFVLTSIAWQ